MISLENIRKEFSNLQVVNVALDGVCLHVERGEFVSVMGPSGCGKTTLLNILGLLDSPDEGRYILNGRDVSMLDDKESTLLRRGTIGFIFQSFNLIDELTVEENVELPLYYLKVPRAERKEIVRDVLHRMSMSHRSDYYPLQLSGGQQQRVAIARAVVTNPQIIIADEPTGNLDSKNGKEVMSLFKELHNAGTTIVMATHNQRDAYAADRILHLFDGQIISPML
ncbi:MAG: ABC transporter ATP-binding protein [Bacteroidales bacterium]|nr:ABC transporter ATP-binding protein [Bacteroidales bacterium]